MTSLLLMLGVAVAPASAESKDVQVDWTSAGIYPQVEPRFYSGVAGAPFSDKTYVTIVCEVRGEAVSNGAATIDIWARISTGGYLPNAFLNTGVDGRTPGVPGCGEHSAPAPAAEKKREPFVEFEYNRSAEEKELGPVVIRTGVGSSGNNIVVVYTDEVVAPSVNLSAQLLDHWVWGGGKSVYLPWSYFEGDSRFVNWLESEDFSVGNKERTYTPAIIDGARFSVGGIRVYQPVEGCYLVVDTYNFDPSKLVNYPYYPLYLSEKIGFIGKDYIIHSTNC